MRLEIEELKKYIKNLLDRKLSVIETDITHSRTNKNKQ